MKIQRSAQLKASKAGVALAALLILLGVSACQKPASEAPQSDQGQSAQPSAQALVSRFSEKRFHRNIEILASDEFGGREPASEGEKKTIEHLKSEFIALGLEPGNNDSFFQPAALVSITADESMVLNVEGRELTYGQDFMAWTKRVEEKSSLKQSELVFVGYGIVAPEYDWNDYAGLDVQGKTVVILVNDPGFATQDDSLFKGNTMTFYGRWTYKYEEAARQGAAGAIIVHETEAAGYPWEVVSGGWSGPNFDLYAENKNMHRTQVEAWMTTSVAESLFETAGKDYSELKAKASTRETKPVALGLKANLEFTNKISKSDSHNVVAKITGSSRPEETVFYTAHWDHMGTRSGEGDQIFNGAVDNATGAAALIELAAAYKSLPAAPERTIVFLAVTAEESGLLGSKYYAENPIFDLATTVAAINIDAGNVHGRTRDITVVGFGASELDNYLRKAAEKQDRVLVAEPTPEKGYYYRSDHFNFAKKGVPALYAEGGVDYIDRPEGWGLERHAEYTANDYHKASDEYDPEWDLSGMLEDMALYFEVGLEIANSEAYPEWSEGSEFRAIRERSRKSAL